MKVATAGNGHRTVDNKSRPSPFFACFRKFSPFADGRWPRFFGESILARQHSHGSPSYRSIGRIGNFGWEIFQVQR